MRRPQTANATKKKSLYYTIRYMVSFRYFEVRCRVHQRPSINNIMDTPRERKLVICLFDFGMFCFSFALNIILVRTHMYS